MAKRQAKSWSAARGLGGLCDRAAPENTPSYSLIRGQYDPHREPLHVSSWAELKPTPDGPHTHTQACLHVLRKLQQPPAGDVI